MELTNADKGPANPAFPRLGHYRVTGIIDRGGTSTVYRATRDGQSFAIKYFERFKSSEGDFSKARLRREAALLARINHPGLVKVIEINETEDHRTFLVLELVQGESLARTLVRGPIDVAQLRAMAMRLTEALAEIHRHRLLHRDLKPANIVLSLDGHPKIIDFGLVVSVKASDDDRASDIAGTLRYSAPEQIGLLKHVVDGRADLYSLGCVLFECATCRVPVPGADLSDLLRRHATEAIPDILETHPKFPRVFASIIRKLLAKDPEDRYSSAPQLLADLQNLDELEASFARGEEIVLGAAAFIRTHEYPLIGREAEIRVLKERWDTTLKGHGQIVIIDGESGSGKSRLVNELLEQVFKTDALVLAGKCPIGQSLPFGALKEALDRFLRISAGLPVVEKLRIDEIVRDALGEFLPVLKDFSPELSKRFSQSTASFTLRSEDVFFEAIGTFLVRLSHQFSALLFFIDDFQWLDEPSRKVFGRLAQHLSKSKIMIVGACRSEAEYSATRSQFVAELPTEQTAFVKLSPLSIPATLDLIRVQLGEREVEHADFVLRIANLSKGNPLAISEYLLAMLEAGFLYPSLGTWSVEFSELERLNLPSDVMQLIINRVSELDHVTRHVLQAAAVLGSPFAEGTLRRMLGQSITSALFSGVEAHLLERQHSFRGEHGEHYSFVHDRVQETLLSSLSAEELQELHQKAAEALESSPPADLEDRQVIYALAQHRILGHVERFPAQAYNANLHAGKTALESYSYRRALEFFNHAYDVSVRFAVDHDATGLLESRAEAALKCTDYPDAIAFSEQALTLATEPIQRARILCIMMDACGGMVELRRVQKIFQQALAELGISFSTSVLGGLWASVKFATIGLIQHKTGWRFGRALGAKEEEWVRLVCRIYTMGMARQLAGYDVRMGIQICARLFYTAHFLGKSAEHARSLSLVALFFGVVRRRKSLERYAHLALVEAPLFGDLTLVPKIKNEIGLAYLFLGDYLKCEEVLADCVQADRQWISTNMLAEVGGAQTFLFAVRGYTAEAAWWYSTGIPAKNAVPAKDLLLNVAQRLGQRAILGDVQGALDDQQWIYDLNLPARIEKRVVAGMVYAAGFVNFYAETGDYSENLEKWITMYHKHGLSPRRAGPGAWTFQVPWLYVRANACFEEHLEKGSVSTLHLTRFAYAVREVKRAIGPIMRQHYLVGLGALLWFQGKPRKALKILDVAEKVSRLGDNQWSWFEALKFRAAIYSQLQNLRAAQKDAKQALSIGLERGWVPRVSKLKIAFPFLQESTSTSHSSPSISPTASAGGDRPSALMIHKYKSHLDALLQLNRATADLGTVADQTRAAVDATIQILKAERGFLLLASDFSPQLEVSIARDSHKNDVPKDSAFSKSMVEKARTTRASVIFTGDPTGELSTSESIVAAHLRSMMAAPLINEDRLIGVMYLDSTVARGIFQQEDLELLEAVCGHVSVSLDAAKSRQLEVERNLLIKEQELTKVRIKSAHAAGMAEVATGSIHNIGNTITTVVINFELLRASLRNMRLSTLVESTATLKSHRKDLQEFAVTDEGVHVVESIIGVGDTVLGEQAKIETRLEKIEQGITSVTDVVSMQQEYAKAGFQQEGVQLEVLVEEAVGLLAADIIHHKITVKRDYARLPLVMAQRNKLAHVVTNLIKNAIEAMTDVPEDRRVLEISAYEDEQWIHLRVRDHGTGIPAEHLQKIFSHRFTTKKGGHGFGLHIAANAMTEMGGSVVAESQGLGEGASLLVHIPKTAGPESIVR